MFRSAFVRMFYKSLMVWAFLVFGLNGGKLLALDSWEKVLDLRGMWQFTIGDDMAWATKGYDDKDWEAIHVPSAWENEGFHGYNGYAWYRKTFWGNQVPSGESLYLILGRIDDVDEVYLNGTRIGSSGAFPPEFLSASKAKRCYPIPTQHLNPHGKNTIAVRIYDSQLSGGIISGDIGIYRNTEEFATDLDLRGVWKFALGDENSWKESDHDDTDWYDINVPLAWEEDGFHEYDGIGWYRIYFSISRHGNWKEDPLYLVLGRIDDFDQVYINGEFIGSTNDGRGFGWSKSYRQLRIYPLPWEYLDSEEVNTLAVRVVDIGGEGGIYEGPVGIIRRSTLLEMQE